MSIKLTEQNFTVGCAAATSSSTGPIILQGPHHSAQKSTTTGMALCKTSVSKFCSVSLIDIDIPFLFMGRAVVDAAPLQLLYGFF